MARQIVSPGQKSLNGALPFPAVPGASPSTLASAPTGAIDGAEHSTDGVLPDGALLGGEPSGCAFREDSTGVRGVCAMSHAAAHSNAVLSGARSRRDAAARLAARPAAAPPRPTCHATAVRWTPHAAALFSAHGDGALREWDPRTWRRRRTLLGDSRWAESIWVTPRSVLAAGADGAVRAWRLEERAWRSGGEAGAGSGGPGGTCGGSGLLDFDSGGGGSDSVGGLGVGTGAGDVAWPLAVLKCHECPVTGLCFVGEEGDGALASVDCRGGVVVHAVGREGASTEVVYR